MAHGSILLDTYLLFLITDLSGIVYRYYLSPVDPPVLRFWSHLFKIFAFGATGDRQREPLFILRVRKSILVSCVITNLASLPNYNTLDFCKWTVPYFGVYNTHIFSPRNNFKLGNACYTLQ